MSLNKGLIFDLPWLFLAALLVQPLLCLSAHAQPPAPPPGGREEMLLFYEEQDLVVTATKQALPVSKVPAVATVITAEQIRAMGARTLVEAIKVATGIGIYQEFIHDKVIEVRGVKTLNSEKILVLLDGIRLNNPLHGGATNLFADLPLDNVKRVEIIRGPASALYGANAFLGVINVITKEGGDIDGVEVTAGGGSWSTQRYNFLAGKKYGDLQVAAQINYLETDGFRGDVEKDADPFPSSNAPGKTLQWRQRVDAALTVSWKDLKLEYRHVNKHLGPYVGVGNALNDESHWHELQDTGELSYRYSFSRDLTVTARAYATLFRADLYWEILSEGHPGFGGGPFPDGVLGNPRWKNRVYGAEVQADYQLFKDNLLTMGINLERIKQYDVQHWTNFDPNNVTPLGAFQDVTGTLNWNQNVHRNVSAWYVQDSWNVTDRLSLIAGVRHDEYNDFGNTTNPRGGLVWEVFKGTHVKLLAGKAFRAPTFEELYNTNNPSVTGNPNLDPEKIATTELSIETRALQSTTLKVSYFKNYFDDTIMLRPMAGGVLQYANSGKSRIAGLELEARYDFNRTDWAYANFTWLESKRLGGGGEIADIPKYRSNIGGNILLGNYFNLNSNLFISDDRPRAAGDGRQDISAYALIDAALTWQGYIKGLSVQLSAKNLFDKRYDDPAPADKVPGDYPRDGREIFLEARYTFW